MIKRNILSYWKKYWKPIKKISSKGVKFSLGSLSGILSALLRRLSGIWYPIWLKACRLCIIFKHIIMACILVIITYFSGNTQAEATDMEGINVPNNIKILLNQIERKYDIPCGLLTAIAALESDFRVHAVGIRGKPIFCKSLSEAKSYVIAALDSGIANLDIGIMQINWYWHSKEFASIDEMFLPENNITYAAKFLINLKKQYGSWEQAVRNYHSSNPKYNDRYYERIISNWEKFYGNNINTKEVGKI